MPRPVDFRLTDLVTALDRTCDDLVAGDLSHQGLPQEWWRRLRLPLVLGRVGVEHVASGLAALALARWPGRPLGEVMPALYLSGAGDQESAPVNRLLAAPLGSLLAELGEDSARELISDAFRTVLDRLPRETGAAGNAPVGAVAATEPGTAASEAATGWLPPQGRGQQAGPDLFREADPTAPGSTPLTAVPAASPAPAAAQRPPVLLGPGAGPEQGTTPKQPSRPQSPGPGRVPSDRSLLAEVDAWFSLGDKRYRAVATRRILTDSPETLDVIGSDFGVTRERIRQIHKQVERDLCTWVGSPSGEGLGSHLTSVTAQLGAAAPLDAFWSLCAEHSHTVPSLGVPLGRVVLALLPEHRKDGEWLLNGSAHDLAEHLRDLLEAKTALPLTEALELARESGVLSRHARAWLQAQPHARVVADRLVRWGRSLPDKAFAVLSALERPLHVDELVSHLGGDFNEAGFRDRIHNDDRLMRRDRRVFGLRSWGGEEYLGVEWAMRRELERAGGQMRVAELAELICGRFDVTESSVRSLAAGSEFDRPRPGWVALHDGTEPAARTSYRPRRSVERTRRCFLDPEGTWWLRLDLNAEHLRGSGFPIPSGFAASAGMYPGVRMPVRIDGREAAATWKNQPLMSSVRPLLVRENAAEGDRAFLAIVDGEVRCRILSAAQPRPGPMGPALRLAGITGPRPDPLSALAEAVGLTPGCSHGQVQQHLTDRGDGDILAVLPAGPAGAS